MSVQVAPSEKAKITGIVRSILPGARILIYGSRTQGRAKTYSDLDVSLMAKGKIPYIKLDQIEEAFSQTDIPYKIDLSDFNSLSPDFQKHILSRHIEW